jgi:peptidoglycan/LPS O-acetylase OafA/YrhL
MVYFNTLLRLLELVAGMLAAKAYLILCHWHRPLSLSLSLALSLLWCLGVIAAGSFSEAQLFYFLRCNFLFAPALVTLMLCVCLTDGPLTRFLSSKPLQFMGDISYSVYIWQFAVIAMLGATLQVQDLSPRGTVTLAGKGALIVGLTTAFAYGSYRLIEVPSRRWLRARLSPPTTDHDAQPSPLPATLPKSGR